MPLLQVVNQIYWTQEVEEAFEAMAAGDKGALKVGGCGWLGIRCLESLMPVTAAPGAVPACCAQAYNEKQVQQLTRLIEVTRTDLSKADRQKVGCWRCCCWSMMQAGPCNAVCGGTNSSVQSATAAQLHACIPCSAVLPPRGRCPYGHTNCTFLTLMQVMNSITIDAHSRDIVQQMVESGAADRDCFAWQAQLRTYWDQ